MSIHIYTHIHTHILHTHYIHLHVEWVSRFHSVAQTGHSTIVYASLSPALYPEYIRITFIYFNIQRYLPSSHHYDYCSSIIFCVATLFPNNQDMFYRT